VKMPKVPSVVGEAAMNWTLGVFPREWWGNGSVYLICHGREWSNVLLLYMVGQTYGHELMGLS
jgi:hypothetical protein